MPLIIHHLGHGFEPHVDETDGRLTYSLPVESSFVTMDFTFEILRRDLDRLQSDPYRRGLLGDVLHAFLQNRFGPSRPDTGDWPIAMQPAEFRAIADVVLHGAATELRAWMAAFKAEHRNFREGVFATTGTSGLTL